jgi:hypothetical protein
MARGGASFCPTIYSTPVVPRSTRPYNHPVTAFAERLRQEFDVRREKNARYSLRAFATLLGTDHASLAQVFRGTRGVPVSKINRLARRLGLDREEAQAYVAAAHAPDDATLAWQRQLRHWSAEALAVVNDRMHFEIVRLIRLPGFRNDSRWIAQQAGASVDQVNIVLQRLLRLGLVTMPASQAWRDLTGLRVLTEKAFRCMALARVRKMAAAQDIQLPERKD